MPNDTTKLKVADIESVSKKLDGFMEKLPEQEQEVLGWILARAQAAGDATASVAPVASTAAPAARAAISSTLARAAGLRGNAAAGSEIGVTWKHAFGKGFGNRLETVSKVAKVTKVTKVTKTPRG